MSARNLVVVVAVLVAAGALAFAVGGSGRTDAGGGAAATPPEAATGSPSPVATAPTAQATGDLRVFRSEEARLEIGYPADWTALNSPDAEVVLVATPNGSDSMLVRVVDLETEVTAEDVPQMQQLTDRIVRSGEGVEVLIGPRDITLAGLPGYYYLYRFLDEASGQEGAHAHYFLFDGDRMIVLVFQALPDERFEDLADVFDRISSSLQILPA